MRCLQLLLSQNFLFMSAVCAELEEVDLLSEFSKFTTDLYNNQNICSMQKYQVV